MIIECPNCNAKYNVPDNKIQGRKRMKCSKCNSVFPLTDRQDEESASEKDTAKIIKQSVGDSLWTDENLRLPNEQKISLAVIKGARAGYIYHLEKPYILIGRGKVDLIIPDKEISRKHVAIEVRNDKIVFDYAEFLKWWKVIRQEHENQTNLLSHLLGWK